MFISSIRKRQKRRREIEAETRALRRKDAARRLWELEWQVRRAPVLTVELLTELGDAFIEYIQA